MLCLHVEIKTTLLNKLGITMGTLVRLSILMLLQMIVHGTLIVSRVVAMGANKGTIIILDVGVDHSVLLENLVTACINFFYKLL